jgi:AraC-like DNA-binding protein
MMSVESILQKYDIKYKEVRLGQAILEKEIDKNTLKKIEQDLENVGFEILLSPELILVEQVKNLIIEYVHCDKINNPKINLSDFLTNKLAKSYSVIAENFKQHTEDTIEKYFIKQRIERVKELITYGELNFSEIAFKLNYSSVAHLSRQFKQSTGMTLSEFRKLAMNDRKPLDKV